MLPRREIFASDLLTEHYRAHDHRDFFDLASVTLPQLALEQVVEAAADPLDGPNRLIVRSPFYSREQLVQLPHLTRWRLPAREPGQERYGEGTPEYRERRWEFARRVLVVGEPSSVPDLCLAWNLRAQRADWRVLPTWIAPDWPGIGGVRERVRRALKFEQPGLDDDVRVHLVSATLPASALSSVASALELPEAQVHGVGDVPEFFTSRFVVGLERTREVYFKDGIG